MAYCSTKCLLEVETLQHWCRTVRTLRHQSDYAEISWVQSVMGRKGLDTLNYYYQSARLPTALGA